MRSRSLIARVTLVTISGLLSVACKGDRPSEPVVESQVLHLEATSDTSLVGIVVTVVNPNPEVVVLDQHEKPVSGILVRFQPRKAGRGGISYGLSVSNKAGRASAGNWTLSEFPGLQKLTASISESSSSVTFSALAVAGAAARIISPVNFIGVAAFPGDTISAWAEVADRFANPVLKAGIPITFTLSSGDVPLSTVELASNESGYAEFTWTVGSEPVRNTLTITSPGLTAVTHELQVIDSQHTALFDLRQIGEDPPQEKAILLGALALSDDGHFIDIYTGRPGTELEGTTKTFGDFETLGERIILKFSNDYQEKASIVGDEIWLERWDPVTYDCCSIWRYTKRVAPPR